MYSCDWCDGGRRALTLSIAGFPSCPQVVAAGRREDRLDGLAKAKLETARIDVNTDREMLEKFVDDMINKCPDVNLSCIRKLTLRSCADA
jgi:NADP-dependent 3-hydroxy acid dehydrogenase YdfG